MSSYYDFICTTTEVLATSVVTINLKSESPEKKTLNETVKLVQSKGGREERFLMLSASFPQGTSMGKPAGNWKLFLIPILFTHLWSYCFFLDNISETMTRVVQCLNVYRIYLIHATHENSMTIITKVPQCKIFASQISKNKCIGIQI